MVSFASTIERSEGCVLIVDALNLAFRWKHSGATEFADAYIQTVKSLATSYKCGRIIITADWGSSTYRKNLLPSYKGNREAMRAEQTEEEAEAFKVFIQEYNNTLMHLELQGFEVFKYKGVEADDLAAYLCKHKDSFGMSQVWLVSSDKDWDLLIADDVSRFSYVTRKETTVDTWKDHYKVPMEYYSTFKAIAGDAGDNIIGVHGIGEARAATLIAKYGDVFDIHASIPIPGTAQYIKALNDFGDNLLLNLELVDLPTYCEDAIGEENCKDMWERLAI